LQRKSQSKGWLNAADISIVGRALTDNSTN